MRKASSGCSIGKPTMDRAMPMAELPRNILVWQCSFKLRVALLMECMVLVVMEEMFENSVVMKILKNS